MTKKTVILFVVICGIGFSQGWTKGLGFAAGMPAGIGFSYRSVGEHWGYQISGGVISNTWGHDDYRYEITSTWWGDDVDTSQVYHWSYHDRNTDGNLGLLFIRPLHRTSRSMFYGFLGLGGFLSINEITRQDWHYVIEDDSTVVYREIGDEYAADEIYVTWYLGAGIGIQWNLTENIRISAEMPVTVTNEKNVYMYVPQIGVHYYFR